MKDKKLTRSVLISRGANIETTNQDQTTLATQLYYKCLVDGRIKPETVAILRKLRLPNRTPRGRPVDVVARELMARRDAIKKVMSDTFNQTMTPARRAAWKENFVRMAPDLWAFYSGAPNSFQSIRYASQSLDVDRKTIRNWRKSPEYQNLVKKFYDEYVGQVDDN